MRAPESHPVMLFDRPAWRQHRERAARQGWVDFLQVEIVDNLIARLDHIGRSFPMVLDLGVGGGALSRAIAARRGVERVVSLDPAIGFLAQSKGLAVAADPEWLPFADHAFDLAVSALALHWVADLPGALVQLRRALKPDGLLLCAMLGGATLVELRTALIEAELSEEGGASPRVSPTVDLADVAGLLQRAGFAMPVADADTITATYPDILALARDLRAMGETNALAARRKEFTRRATLTRANSIYRDRYALADGRIPATFEIHYLTAWTPGAGQPKPLKPGSAQRRLAEALGVVEFSAGDRTAP